MNRRARLEVDKVGSQFVGGSPAEFDQQVNDALGCGAGHERVDASSEALGRLTRQFVSTSGSGDGHGVEGRRFDKNIGRCAVDFGGCPTHHSRKTDRAGLVELTRTAEYYGQLQRVLRKVDLASMHHSLEVRVPVLSRKLIEVSALVDADFCLRDGERKGPLRDLLRRRVPGGWSWVARRRRGP